MIDLHYYMENKLSKENCELLKKYFGKKEFQHIYQAAAFFKELKNYDWISVETLRAEVLKIGTSFALCLDDLIPSVEDTLKLIYKDFNASLMFPGLKFGEGGNNKLCTCPECGDKKAFIGGKGQGATIICNHRNKCKYSQSFYKYYLKYVNTSGNLSTFAEYAGVDIYEYEIHMNGTKPIQKEVPKKYVETVNEEVVYQYFDEKKEFSNVENISDYVDLIDTLRDEQKVRLIYEFFFRIIKIERNKDNEKRRTPMWSYLISKRKIDIDNKNIKNIGFLHLNESATLLKHLIKKFTLKNLLLTKLVKEVNSFSFKNREAIESTLKLLSDHVSSTELVEKGILYPLDSDKPLEFNYKGSVNLIKLLAATFGNEKVAQFGVHYENEKLYSFSFQFLFNEKVEKSGLIFLRSQALYSNTTEEFRIRPTHIKKGLEDYKEIQLSSGLIDALPFGLSNEALRLSKYIFIDEGPIDFLSWGNEIVINGETQKVYGCGIPGVHRLPIEHITLFKGKKVLFFFDVDFAGQTAVRNLQNKFKELEIDAKVAIWNPHFFVKNVGSLIFHKTLKNHMVKVHNFNYKINSFKDINEIKKELAKENHQLPFNTLDEFVRDYVTFN